MREQTNPLLCDIETGMCETHSAITDDTIPGVSQSIQKPVKIIYFTDPICSSCWGIEPQLRKLKLEYGDSVEFDYRMGGLLPDWGYNSGGISKPTDVAHHWDEMSAYYDMPIDGDIWLEDPLNSSFQPSIAFKAAQMQSKEKAVFFFRTLREMVFLQKKNITKWEHIENAAKIVELNIVQLKDDYENNARQLFQEDLNFKKKLGVRGFPSLFFVYENGKTEFIYGLKPYSTYEAVLESVPNIIKNEYEKSWENLFSKYNTLTAKEFSELSGTSRSESENILNDLAANGKLEKQTTKNGSLWKLK
jgi:putative protein-disulfide isomerase